MYSYKKTCSFCLKQLTVSLCKLPIHEWEGPILGTQRYVPTQTLKRPETCGRTPRTQHGSSRLVKSVKNLSTTRASRISRRILFNVISERTDKHTSGVMPFKNTLYFDTHRTCVRHVHRPEVTCNTRPPAALRSLCTRCCELVLRPSSLQFSVRRNAQTMLRTRVGSLLQSGD